MNSCKDPVLEDCLVPQCSEKNSSETCEGIIGCYWCENNKDDIPLEKAYCASADVCFKGKEGIRDESSFRIVQPKKMAKKPWGWLVYLSVEVVILLVILLVFCRELGLDSFVGTSVFRITFYVPFCFFFSSDNFSTEWTQNFCDCIVWIRGP